MNRSTLCSLIRYAKRPLSSVTFMGMLFISLNTAITPSARAAIYKCISGTGAVTYSGRKCPEEDTTARIIADSGVGSADKRRTPAPAAANPSPGSEQPQRQPPEAGFKPLPEGASQAIAE